MKFSQLLSIIFLFVTMVVSSQTMNQFDENGKRHGIWKKMFDDTNIVRYEGEFNHGKEIGLFKFYKNINKKAVLTATRQFNKNNDETYVKFFSSRGKLISEGAMNGKLYVDEWKYYQKTSDELMTLEHYNDKGNLDGERFVYYPNGQVAESQNYINGKLHGASIWYSLKNVILKEFIYVDGELHGMSKYYNPRGELIAEGLYKRDKKNGIWKYYENGELIREKDFTYKPKYIKKGK